ncbi:glycosyltransferase family 2 protein [Viridothelium virens]|uniref:dolichyl-phosphate beta-glucosyltransferase n=1 Tax=Viridothelium virens TaxID=1048519 RepID=A0A6A6GT08_VIRVR|nr:glycosyltransferase family 2 protein [Viridothelium virens]
MGPFDAAIGIAQKSLQFVQETSPSLIFLGFAVSLLVGSALLYLTLYLVAPVPRPPYPSEKTYTTILPDGSPSSPQPLPSWLDSHIARKNLARRKHSSKLLEDIPVDPASVFISVVVPAYNEETRLAGMLEEAVEYLQDAYGDAHGPSVEATKPSTSATQRRGVNGSGKGQQQHQHQDGSTGMNGAVTAAETTRAPGRGWEILIVSDGSTDATLNTALSFARSHQLEQYPFPTAVPGPWRSGPASKKATQIPHGSIRVVSLEQNRGKGGAVVHGMRHVRGEYVVFADADGASKFEDLGRLVKGCREVEDERGRGVAIGSRAHLVGSEAVVKRSAIRNFLMHSFHLLLRLMTPPATSRIRDTQCGFKLFSRASLPFIVPYMHSEGWIFDVEMLMLAELGGIPMTEVAIGWKEVLGSKLNVLWDSLGMAWGLAILRLAWAMGVYRRN